MVLSLGAIIMIYYKSRPFCFWEGGEAHAGRFLTGRTGGDSSYRYKAIVPVLPKEKLPLGLLTRWEILTRRLLVSYRPHL